MRARKFAADPYESMMSHFGGQHDSMVRMLSLVKTISTNSTEQAKRISQLEATCRGLEKRVAILEKAMAPAKKQDANAALQRLNARLDALIEALGPKRFDIVRDKKGKAIGTKESPA